MSTNLYEKGTVCCLYQADTFLTGVPVEERVSECEVVRVGPKYITVVRKISLPVYSCLKKNNESQASWYEIRVNKKTMKTDHPWMPEHSLFPTKEAAIEAEKQKQEEIRAKSADRKRGKCCE